MRTFQKSSCKRGFVFGISGVLGVGIWASMYFPTCNVLLVDLHGWVFPPKKSLRWLKTSDCNSVRFANEVPTAAWLQRGCLLQQIGASSVRGGVKLSAPISGQKTFLWGGGGRGMPYLEAPRGRHFSFVQILFFRHKCCQH